MTAAAAEPLDVELTVLPVSDVFSALLDIRGVVKNVGSATIDTEVWQSILLVNGEPSDVWGLAIANGLRDPREFALPPGDTVEFRRSFPSASILQKVGRYELVLQVRGVCSPAVTIERY